MATLRRNTDLDLIRYLVDLLEAEREHNVIQDRRLFEIERKCAEMSANLNNVETKVEECQNSVEFLEAEIPDLRYLVDRNQELECWADPYSADGDAICNSQNID